MPFGDPSQVPAELVPVAQLQVAISQLNYGNLHETIQKVRSIQAKLPNYDDLANTILDMARIRTKLVRLYAHFVMSFGEKENGLESSLLEAATIQNGPMLRYLYTKKYFTETQISQKITNDRKFHYFFLEQFPSKVELNITKENVSPEFYDKIRKLKNSTPEDRICIYKVGYKMKALGFYIKQDDLNALTNKWKAKIPKFCKVCLFEVVKGKMPPIDLAAFYGSADVFNFFLTNGGQITPQTTGLALYSGNQEIFEICLRNVPNSYQECFIPAMQTYRNDLFEEILKVKPMPEILSKNWELLMRAKNYGVIWSFFLMGIDFNTTNGSNTLLHLSIVTHQFMLTRYLINTQHNMINLESSSGNKPLSLALARGFKNIAKVLIENGANVNVMFGTHTLLETAVKYEQWQTIRYLTAKGGVLSYDYILTLKNCTQQSRAMILGYPKIDFSNANNSPLLNAIFEEDCREIQRLIKDKDTNINEKNEAGYSALHLAIITKNTDAAGILLGRGCEINTVNIFGETPVMACCREDSMFDIFNIMVERGALLNYKNSAGINALHVAASFERSEYVGLLIMKGANKNQADCTNKMPIDYTNSPLIKSLLSQPAIYNFV